MRWIPISERLPSEQGEYLVTLDFEGDTYVECLYYGKPTMANREVKGECFYYSDDEWGDIVYDTEVTAWMPLPNPYTADHKTEPQTETQTETQTSNKNSNVISVYDGVSEAVRCAMCSNPNKSDRGCDGACSYDEKLYERIMKAITESIVKTEPQYDIDKGTIKCDNCSENGSYKCSKCDGEMYFKRIEIEDEPQNDARKFLGCVCETCKHRDEEWDSEACDGCCENDDHYEPQTERVETMSCQECKWWFTDSLGHGGYCQNLLYNQECRYEPKTEGE